MSIDVMMMRMTAGPVPMKAIVLTDQGAGTAGMKLVERPGPQAAMNGDDVHVHPGEQDRRLGKDEGP